MYTEYREPSSSIYTMSSDSVQISFLLCQPSAPCCCHLHFISTHTHHCFNSHFPRKPRLASYPFDSQSPVVASLSILSRQNQTFHSILDAILPTLCQHLSVSIITFLMQSYQLFVSICQSPSSTVHHSSQSASSLHSTSPNHLNPTSTTSLF